MKLLFLLLVFTSALNLLAEDVKSLIKNNLKLVSSSQGVSRQQEQWRSEKSFYKLQLATLESARNSLVKERESIKLRLDKALEDLNREIKISLSSKSSVTRINDGIKSVKDQVESLSLFFPAVLRSEIQALLSVNNNNFLTTLSSLDSAIEKLIEFSNKITVSEEIFVKNANGLSQHASSSKVPITAKQHLNVIYLGLDLAVAIPYSDGKYGLRIGGNPWEWSIDEEYTAYLREYISSYQSKVYMPLKLKLTSVGGGIK